MEINNTNTGNETMKKVIENTAILVESYNNHIKSGKRWYSSEISDEFQKQFVLTPSEARYAVKRSQAVNECGMEWILECDQAAANAVGKEKRVRMVNNEVFAGTISSAYFAGLDNRGSELYTCVLTAADGAEHTSTFRII